MIPKIIWQTYECEYKDLPQKALECIASWQEKNPEWEYKYISGKERSNFVLNNFGEEWFNIYNSYKTNILRSDLWRYMCLYINGGLYVDLDILCKKPMHDWFNTNINFFVSEEPNGPGYSQMIFASEINSIFLKNTLDNIKIKYYEFNKYNNIVEYVTNEVGYIIFNKSITQTVLFSDLEKDKFVLYSGESAKNLHLDLIHHYRAGKKESFFGPSYCAWQTEEYK